MLRVKRIFEFVSIMLLMSIMLNVASVKASTDVSAWSITTGGYLFEVSEETIHLWANESGEWIGGKRIVLYRDFDPQTNFKISFEVKAAVLGNLHFVLGEPSYWGYKYGAPSEIGFTFSRRSTGDDIFEVDAVACVYYDYCPAPYEFSTACVVASGQENVWYKVVMTVHRSPYRVVAKVFEEHGGLLCERAIDMDSFLDSVLESTRALQNMSIIETVDYVDFRNFDSIGRLGFEVGGYGVGESNLYIRDFSVHGEHQSQWHIGEVEYIDPEYLPW